MRTLSRVLTAVLLAAALASCGGDDGSDATPTTVAAPEITVMSRNLYLGADLAPLFEATPETLTATARATYDQVVSSEVADRLSLVADEIVAADPDLVALQEASVWSVQAEGAGAPTVLYDYVEILRDALVDLGEPYTVAVAADGFAGGLPVADVGLVTLQDRDVILVRDDSAVTVEAPRTGVYDERLEVSVAGASIPVVRGWAAVDASTDGAAVSVVATHLEAFDDDVRDAQQIELLGVTDALEGPVLVIGDLNSAAGGADDTTYRAMLAEGFEDVWTVNGDEPGLTCCRSADVRSGEMTERIDFILGRGALTPVSASVTGTSAMTAGGRTASDHMGLVATLRVDS
jgi:endonuclease/exonuclease/phosphatase family metal-dependent hydrolase